MRGVTFMPRSLAIIWSFFSIFANLIDWKWYLIAILNFIPFITNVFISLLVNFNKFQMSINGLYFFSWEFFFAHRLSQVIFSSVKQDNNSVCITEYGKDQILFLLPHLFLFLLDKSCSAGPSQSMLGPQWIGLRSPIHSASPPHLILFTALMIIKNYIFQQFAYSCPSPSTNSPVFPSRTRPSFSLSLVFL